MRKIVAALVAAPVIATAAQAQDYPTQPITVVVGFSAGGGMDTLARLVGERAGEALGQQIAVENRPGAGGTIAAAHVANATPDGYTLLLGETTALIGPVVHGDVGYDPVEGFAPVAHLTSAPLAFVANPEIGVETVEEFLELVSESPGEYFYATPGVATVQHLAVEILMDQAGLDMEDVAFQGGAPSVTAVVSGEVPFGIVSLNAAAEQAAGGNLNIIGVTTEERVPAFPDIEAFSEHVEGFAATPSQFLMAPAGTPDAVIATLSDAIEETMNDAGVLATLDERGFLVDYIDGATLAAQLPEMVATWTQAAEAADQAGN